jgi:endonuclease/exonuclease/phosphatase family metal-dependent hydrolase
MNDNHLGMAIIIKANIPHCVVDIRIMEKDGCGLQAIKFDLGGNSWCVVNICIGNDTLTHDSDWAFLSDLETVGGNRMLICGDYNARHEEWGNNSNNSQGRVLNDALMETNWTIVNRSHVTRLAERLGDYDSNIDLTLASPLALSDINWRALTYQGSDHLPCSITITKIHQLIVTPITKPFKYI